MVAVTCAGTLAVVYPLAEAVIVTAPISKPVTCGWTAGAVSPAPIVIVVGDIVNFERLLLPSVMVTLDAAGAPKFTGKATVLPKPTLALDGSVIVPGGVMVTLAVALAIFGVVVLAVIVVEPCPTGAVATPGFEEFSVNVTPEGACAERTRERFCTPAPAVTLTVGGKKLADAVTWTDVLAVPYPLAEAVTVAVPKSMPFTAGVALGEVCPPLMKTLPATVTFDVSLLESKTVTPFAGAGAPRVMVNGACWPGGTVIAAGTEIEPCAVTLQMVSARLGKLLAWITVLPDPTMVSGTGTVMDPCANVTLEGTVPTLTLLEDRFTARPPEGAGPERVSVRFCVPPPVKVTLGGVKAMVAVTCTVALPEEYPVAVALMLADPILTPVIVGCWVGADAPCAMETLDAEIVTFEGSVLASATVTAESAGADKVTGNGMVWPNPTLGLDGRLIGPKISIVTLAVTSAMFGRLLAWIKAEPAATPVTGTLVLVAPGPKATVSGTVATPVLLELKLIVKPLAGAAAERVSVRFCVIVPVMVRLGSVKAMVALTCTAVLPDV
jgi:hypothetical protein